MEWKAWACWRISAASEPTPRIGLRLAALVFSVTFATLIGGYVVSATQSKKTAVVISCGAVGVELELCRTGAEAWAKERGQEVQIVTAANNSSDRLANYQLLLAAHSSDIDVFVIDTPWPGIIGDFFVDLSGHIGEQELKDYFPAFVENNRVKNRLTAIPWFIDGGLLYYRKDLLAKYDRRVPVTWSEMTETARFIQDKERAAGHHRLWGYVFQARAYEGLTCNALEWIASSGGGTIIDDNGNVTINNPRAKEMLKLASTWIGKITPPGALNYMEEETRAVFQSGDAVFMRNWPYAFKLGNAEDSPIRGKIGVSVLPKGASDDTKPAATLGGWSLAVSRFSKNQEAAIDLVKYIASAKEQKRRVLEGGLSPTLRSLYSDKDLLKKAPQLEVFLPIFDATVPRPSRLVGPDYNRVSSEFFEAVHATLSTGQVESRLEQLEKSLLFLKKKGRWRP